MFYKDNNFSLVLFAGFLVSSAFYVLPPGYPQPGHALALLIIAPVLWGWKKVSLGVPEKLLLLFWGYASAVNLIFWFMHRDLSFIVSTVYWTYGIVLFFAVRQVFLVQPKLGVALCWALLIVLPVQIPLGLFGGEGFYRNDRFFGTFTDPNQLSYWFLCLFVGALLSSSKPRWLGPSAAVAIFTVMGVLFVLSSSRSALLAALVLLGGIVSWWLEDGHTKKIVDTKKATRGISGQTSVAGVGSILPTTEAERMPLIQKLVAFSFVLLVLMTVFLLLYQFHAGVQTIVDNVVLRSQKSGLLWELDVRGYLRLLEFPQYLLFGAGQGFDGRFMEPLDGYVIYEVHSSLIAPLFYYGIIGFGLLYASFYLMARDRLEGWQWLVFAAPFIYGLFTYGLRTPVFWIMLASLYTIPTIAATAAKTADKPNAID